MSEMDPKDFLSRLEELLPQGKRPQGKAEWVVICEALKLPTDVGVAEMIESVYTEKGLMLSAYREGDGRERRQKIEGAGGVAVLKDMLTAITESNLNTQALPKNLNVQMNVVWMLIRFETNVTDFSIINRSGVNGCKHYHFVVIIHKLGGNVKHHLCDA